MPSRIARRHLGRPNAVSAVPAFQRRNVRRAFCQRPWLARNAASTHPRCAAAPASSAKVRRRMRLFVVVSGRFAVEIGGNPEPVTEIGQGATIGEIAFFAGGPRTATVRAIRDSVVVRLTRTDFDEISKRSPGHLANHHGDARHAACSRNPQEHGLRQNAASHPRAAARPRTIALIHAGTQAGFSQSQRRSRKCSMPSPAAMPAR